MPEGTGKPYEWPVQTLADLKIEELPVITEAQAREFARQAYEMVPESMRPKSLAVGLKSPEAFANLPEQRGTFEAVQDALQYIPNQALDYDSWVRIGMAIKGALAEQGWPLFESWSASSSKNDAKTTAKSWGSFSPQRIGAGTIYKLALDNGWIPDADLQLNGEIVMNGHHPAKGLLQALQTQTPITLDASGGTPAVSLPLPPPKPLPTGWDQVGGVIADMMTLMAATAKRPQPVLALGASLCAIGALMGRKYRTESKQSVLIDLMKRPEGATLPQMVEATGWQAHTVRGCMAGTLKKKLGLTIDSVKESGGERVYRVSPSSSLPTASKTD